MSAKRGGSASARAAGLKGIVLHVHPEEYGRLADAAQAAGQDLKHFCADLCRRAVGLPPEGRPAGKRPLQKKTRNPLD
jgi:hypothetical protein